MHVRSCLARLAKPPLVVTALCFLLPDLVDKPLWVLGVISDGRYMGHTLLAVFSVATVLSMAGISHGMLGLFGGTVHLLFDTIGSGFVPWFYPFKQYNFPEKDFHSIVTVPLVTETLMEMVVVCCTLFLASVAFRGLVGAAGKRYGRISHVADRLNVVITGWESAGSRRASAHGGVLCWTARLAGTLLSMLAVGYVLCSKAEYDDVWLVIPAGLCVFVLSVAPSLVAWRSHRIGGGLLLIVCMSYTELASRVVEGPALVGILSPFLAALAATGIMHLLLSWKE